jgi:choline dehydrogenase-like flavoprotein
MIEDLDVLGVSTLDADVCIVGAGATGLALAHELSGTRLRVVVLEAGGEQRQPASDALNVADSTGPLPVDATSARARVFGGTSTLWAGQCLRLEPDDFERREWLPHSGWPFRLSEFEPFYARAERLLGIDATYDERVWRPFRISPPPLDPDRLVARSTVYPRRIDLGRVLRGRLAAARNVRVLLHANAVRVDPDVGHGSSVRALGSDRRALEVRSRATVLCGGGIENARLLLLSELNPRGLVGRFFQEHPNGFVGEVVDADYKRLQDLFAMLYRRGRRFLPRLALSPSTRAAEQLLGCASVLVFEHPPDSAAAAAKGLLRAVRARQRPPDPVRQLRKLAAGVPDLARLLYRRYALGRSPASAPTRIRLQAFCEQGPQPDSRVTLGTRRDALGTRIPEVRWALTDDEVRTLKGMTDAVDREFKRLALGRVRPEEWLLARGTPPLQESYHHMGTTRMTISSRDGVVDAQGRLHDNEGVYCSGPSCFPTSGYANPTLTGIALSIRLADHLQARLA